uniref:Protein krueppel n=1 Tax=Pectinophora gossypiella TaxID=13191 RepID=A0A1E1WQA9_PECGO
MTAAAWKPEKDICRCCHAEGSYHNLSEPRFVLGQTEVYSDMLKSCFNVELSTVSGMLSAPTFTICEPCILRLRDASNFKKQVLRCEERFKDMFKNIIQALRPEFDVKQEVRDDNPEVKVEFVHMDDEDDAVDMKFDDSDDDQPVIQIKVEQHSKKKGKTKVKSKPKSKKPVKNQELNEEAAIEIGNSIADEPDMGEDGEDESSKPKKDATTAFKVVQVGDERMFECVVCARQFRKRQLVRQHYLHVHLKRRPKKYKCRLCNFHFTCTTRPRHMETAHNIQRPKCNICDKKFSYPFLLLQHQKYEHLGEKHYICQICGKAFGNANARSRHKLTHFNENLLCPHCPTIFKQSKSLKYHMKTQHGAQTVTCPICNERFIQSSDLKLHVRVKHPELC